LPDYIDFYLFAINEWPGTEKDTVHEKHERHEQLLKGLTWMDRILYIFVLFVYSLEQKKTLSTKNTNVTNNY